LGSGIAEDLKGNLWIGTREGLYKFDKERKVFTLYQHDPTDSASLTDNNIISLLIDRAGALWLTTSMGIDKVDPNQKPFGVLRPNPLDPRSLSHRRISAICEDKSGTVWIGTMGGGLNVFDKKTNTFSHFRHDPKNGNSLRSDMVSAILEDSDGNLWIGNGEVLSVFNHKEKNFTHTYLHHPFLPTNMWPSVFTIYEDRQQVLWLGTNNGMMSLDRKTGRTKHYPYDPDNPEGISDYWALAILEDSKGNLWIGAGSQALNKFERQTGKFFHFKHSSRKPGSIASNTVSSIYEDSKGNLWFGTGEGGLCRFDHATATFINYTEKQGLAGNAIYSIAEDNQGYIWLGTNNGLSRFSSATETFTNYDADDGLQSKLFTSLYTDGACFKGKDGRLYFGGTSGLNAFDPEAIRSNPYVPPVVITQFRLFDKPLPGKSEANEISLDYDQNFFSLEFAALNYTNPGKNQYAYQLEGVNKDWVSAGTNRLASFTNVAPGSYRFKVKGSNNDGLWNNYPTTLAIIIHPPFWRTWWAYTLYALLFVTGLVLARREVVRRERLRADLKINQLESDKLRELDSLKSHFFANISHEFRTPLTLIQGTVTKLEKEDAFPGRQVDYRLIERNADRLLQLINQLLDLSKLEAGKLDLHPKPGELTVFLKILAASFASLYQSKHIAYSYDLPEEPLHVRFDADKLEKIVVNLLCNAYKFTPAGGEVTFSARVSEKDATYCKVHLTISDSGIGIPAEQLPRVFDRFYQADASATRDYEGTGIGLALVKELVDLHGGIISVESSQEKGTTFFVRLPLGLTPAPTSREDELLPGPFTQKVNSLPDAQYEEDQALSGKKVQEQAVQVLVVEDNTELRRFLTQNLLREYTVLEAENGLKGYEQAIRTIPDVIISDVMMPGLDGVSLCGKLKTDERTSHIPFILLTAKADVESRLQGLSTGADDYLTKPFNLEELQLRIRNLLESRNRIQERFGKQIHLDPQQIPVTSTDERFLQRVLSLMEANLSDTSFDVEAFSKEIGLSRTHLHRKLTALTGQAPNEFIRTFRLKRAASLLRQQHGNVSEIAYAVGFSTLNYFTKCFKDLYGVTPSEYVRNPSPSEVAGR
jgi:signal transduction histidine kinase/DNA-binding response OmpR family regulator/streptogramin lyase